MKAARKPAAAQPEAAYIPGQDHRGEAIDLVDLLGDKITDMWSGANGMSNDAWNLLNVASSEASALVEHNTPAIIDHTGILALRIKNFASLLQGVRALLESVPEADRSTEDIGVLAYVADQLPALRGMLDRLEAQRHWEIDLGNKPGAPRAERPAAAPTSEKDFMAGYALGIEMLHACAKLDDVDLAEIDVRCRQGRPQSDLCAPIVRRLLEHPDHAEGFSAVLTSVFAGSDSAAANGLVLADGLSYERMRGQWDGLDLDGAVVDEAARTAWLKTHPADSAAPATPPAPAPAEPAADADLQQWLEEAKDRAYRIHAASVAVFELAMRERYNNGGEDGKTFAAAVTLMGGIEDDATRIGSLMMDADHVLARRKVVQHG